MPTEYSYFLKYSNIVAKNDELGRLGLGLVDKKCLDTYHIFSYYRWLEVKNDSICYHFDARSIGNYIKEQVNKKIFPVTCVHNKEEKKGEWYSICMLIPYDVLEKKSFFMGKVSHNEC